MMTTNQIFGSDAAIARTKGEWEKVAKEKITVEYIGGAYYAYGTELAMLRLSHRYHGNNKARAGLSSNLNTWYFRLEVV